MNFRTYEDLNRIVFKNIDKIPADIDLIVGIPRSGMLVASMIALYLNIPLTDINSFLEGNIFKSGNTRKKNWVNNINEARRILLVDDSVDTGKALEEARLQVEAMECANRIVTCAVFVTPKSIGIPDIYFDVCEGPRMFEWNYLHHSHLTRACFDLDGVLCRDPVEKENDDGEEYMKFIQTVPARIVPTFRISCIITARLEKYRFETEKWLKKNGIQYDELIMMPLATKEERIKSASHGDFKGKKYKEHKNSMIFIESSEWQAIQIANKSGKAVFCIENHQYYPEGKIAKIKEKTKNSNLKTMLVKLLPKRLVKELKKYVK